MVLGRGLKSEADEGRNKGRKKDQRGGERETAEKVQVPYPRENLGLHPYLPFLATF